MRTIMVDPYWYPALNVAAHFGTDFAGTHASKKAGEMIAVAIAMAGMQEIHQKEYLIQGVPDSEQSPDVRTLCREGRGDGKSPLLLQQDVEVVTYTNHSTNLTLAEFVAKTKFAPDSAYDDKTTILVKVKAGARLPSPAEWASALVPTGKQNDVLVIGKINETKPEYKLAFVHPVFRGEISYDALALLKKQGYTKVTKWSFGSKDIITMDDNEHHCPFERFGVKCKLLKNSEE